MTPFQKALQEVPKKMESLRTNIDNMAAQMASNSSLSEEQLFLLRASLLKFSGEYNALQWVWSIIEPKEAGDA